MTGRPPPLAGSAEPLGKLQRGLGSGYLWALDADRAVAHALLLHCIFNDPRWDRQLDARVDYYATLALDTGLDVAMLEPWLRRGDEDLETTHDVLAILGRMAVRRHEPARRALRDYVGYGRFWDRAIELLIEDYDVVRSDVPWPEVVAGLDAVLGERFGSDAELAEVLAGVDSRARPWTLWAVENPRIAAALAFDHGTNAAPVPKRAQDRPRRTAARPREMSTADLLAVTEDSRWTQIAEELTTRTSTDDVQRLLAAANEPELPMRRAAILALGHQGRRELLEIAEANTSEVRRGTLQGAIALALEAMPPEQTRSLAHDWLTSSDWARRRKAAGILATWAEGDDLEHARRALGRELDLGLEGDMYVVCSLAEALGRYHGHGPFEELSRAYEQIPYSYGRRFVVSALAATDPMFSGDVAVDCLWDCEPETRQLAATHVDRRIRLASQRLDELAGDEAQAASVRRAAALA
ncbi:MAG TPA: hypothetical protein VMY78_12045 [Solirubrobacteraceae bacterium]|nr:hypothetical protein [Solirubrobacteraceae bacterium]